MRSTALLVAAGGNVTGPAYAPDDPTLTQWTFHSAGAFTATVQIQGTVDPALQNWEFIADISGSGMGTFDGPLRAVRAVVSSYVSGAVSVFVGAAGAA